MPQTSTYAGTSKTASDAAFYAGFAKGFTSGLEGIILFLSRKELRSILLQSLEILKQGQLFYVLACLLLFLLFKDPADDWGTLIWTFWRWGRIVSVVVTLILDRRFHANSKMFFTALKAKHPAYGDALETMPPVRRTAADHVQKVKRVAKVGAIRCLRACIKYAWPSAAQFVLPIMEFSSIRPVLGTAIASAITLTHFVPDSLMEATSVDEVISSFGEAIIDADNLGHDATRDFNRRIESPEVKEYFQERYRGYLVGSGFFNSLLMQIPFLGIPLTLISRCAAAVVVVDIVERNLEKDHRKPLPCEDVLRESSHYPESKTTKQA